MLNFLTLFLCLSSQLFAAESFFYASPGINFGVDFGKNWGVVHGAELSAGVIESESKILYGVVNRFQ